MSRVQAVTVVTIAASWLLVAELIRLYAHRRTLVEEHTGSEWG